MELFSIININLPTQKELTMAENDQKKRSWADRLRELLENLGKSLQPTPPAPQPIPVRPQYPRRYKV